jgi:hypothetical protein
MECIGIAALSIQLFLGTQLSGDVIKDRIRTDQTFFAPGIGAELALLNDDAAAVFRSRGKSCRVSKAGVKKELFKDIFRVESQLQIYFEDMYFCGETAFFFIDGGKVRAIAGFQSRRVTPEAVALDQGIEHFLFTYGNKGLSVIQRGSETVYIYQTYGIALFCGPRSSIPEFYIIFAPESRP